MKRSKISIDSLIDIVSKGGTVKTGVDIYNKKGLLLLDKDVLIKKISPLLLVKNSGIVQIPVIHKNNGGVWNKDGQPISLEQEKQPTPSIKKLSPKDEIDVQLVKISELKKEAKQTRKKARQSFKKVISEIEDTGGEFDVNLVKKTVNEVFDFVARNDNAFSYLAKEIISYDDYLYNHSINVCAIGTAILKKFNDHFSEAINSLLQSKPESYIGQENKATSFLEYQAEDLKSLSLGYFLHDVGKVLIPPEILNKTGRLTDAEFDIIKTHSYIKGVQILEKNHLGSIFAENIAKYHHSALFNGEGRCYPDDKLPIEIPLYVKICKLADIYDAMTSKRCYKDAMNPTGVVTNIYREYADKDNMLQFMLHSFVKVVGIYPPGSIIFLVNGQLAYVIDSEGPIAIPFTDKRGNTLKRKQTPLNLSYETEDMGMAIDRRKPLKTPIELYDQLPSYLQSYAK